MKKNTFALILMLSFTRLGYGQLGEIIKNNAASGARQGAEYGAQRAIDKGVDALFRKKSKKNKSPQDVVGTQTPAAVTAQPDENTAATLKAYGKFDFIPGDKILAFEDFSQDAVGDFPGKWTTNASGEIMTIDNHPGSWLNISKQGAYIPKFITSLPENFTLEYDVLFSPPEKPQGPNTGALSFQIICNNSPEPAFDNAGEMSYFELDPYLGQVNIAGLKKNGEKILRNEFQVKGLQRQNAFSYHVAVWRQNMRLRVYLNETKAVDVPSLLLPNVKYNNVHFSTSLNNDGSNWYLSNLKYSSGLPDLRAKILNDGKVSTSGIVFDLNSAILKPASYGVLKEIAELLRSTPALRIKIVGHTDSDGEIASNETLSKSRAAAVKQTLANEFSIETTRMETDGKGETEPAVPNTTAEGKAQNRRVEFIRL